MNEDCQSCGKWCHPFDRYSRGEEGPWHKLCLPPRNEKEKLRQMQLLAVKQAMRNPFREKMG